MRRFLSRVLPLLLSFGLIFNCTGCSTVLVLAGKARENSEASSSVISESSASSGIISTPVPTEDGDLRAFYTDVATAESVTVMVYMIGSDLESEDGSATDDLLEMADAALSENVHLVLQTGGTETWWNDVCTDDESERFVIENGDMTLLQSLGSMNMTDADTLSDFIRFSAESYPADRYELILWDHGGGTMTGFGYDELYEDTSLTLSSLSTALYNGGVQFDFIGFDACLMATLDTAGAVNGFARYMVASQEMEPANGWRYAAWTGALGADTSMSPEKLGRIICDTYLDGCRQAGTEDNATLSLVDLGKIPLLNLTWNALGLEAVSVAMDNESFYAAYGRQAKASENYVNSRVEGYTNMVDAGALVRRLKKVLPEFAKYFLDALGEAVVHEVHGPCRSPSGLSVYYPFDGDSGGFASMMQTGNITAFLVLNGLQLGFLDADSAVAHLERISADISRTLEDDALAPEGAAPEGQSAAPEGGSRPPHGPPTGHQGPSDAQNPWFPLQSALSAVFEGQRREGQAPANAILLMEPAVNAVAASVAPLRQLDISSLEDFRVTVGDGGEARLDLGPERVRHLDSVQFYLACFDLEDDLVVLLGKDADMEADWENGVFKDNFQGRWAALNEHLVYMEVTHQDEARNHYAVPVKLNGVRCNLLVVYDFAKEEYRILGARRLHDENIMDKALISLKKGDTITTIFLAMPVDDDHADFQEMEADTFTLGENIVFADTDMGDGQFMFLFEMTDVQNNSAMSQIVTIEVKDGTAVYSE